MAAFGRELRDSDVALVPLRRVYVLGSVTKPGIYFADPLGTFAQAIAMAGGTTVDGDPTRIRVVRGGTAVVPRTALDAVMSASELRSGDQIFVERRSWFDRNSAAVVGAGAGLLGVIATLLLVR
jgi:protein involved in polysaccharide export with SLBB domain